MARQSLIVQVFVVSPSDVTEERATLETVILQLNQIWSRTLGLTFELLKWETAVRPAFATDPQAVINSQIASDYDVLIGVFWGRLGTETPRGVEQGQTSRRLANRQFVAEIDSTQSTVRNIVEAIDLMLATSPRVAGDA